MSGELTIFNGGVAEIIEAVKNLPVIKKDDFLFLQEHSEHLSTVLAKTHMWRTDIQKKSILSDVQFPTVHAKFHQSILEQKVQFEQTMYLAKDFEMKKLEIEELECDLEEADVLNTKRGGIRVRQVSLDIKFKQFEMQQMQTAMNFRMEEVRGWQEIQDVLLTEMRDQGMSEDIIWSKNDGELRHMFYLSLNNLQGYASCTDSAERSNLLSLAAFTVKQAESVGLLAEFTEGCNAAQQDSLNFIMQYFQQMREQDGQK